MSLLEAVASCYENISPFQTTMAVSAILLYIMYLFLKDMNVPPGPKGIPLLGYWPFLKEDTCHLHLYELAKKYGDVFSFRVTGNLFINLGSVKAIREVSITKPDHFEIRFAEGSMLSTFFPEGLITVQGEQWKVLRKFFASKLKEYGMNAVKENAAPAIYESMKETVEEMQNANGHPIDIIDLVTMKCLMVMRRIMFNDQGITRDELREMRDQYSEVMKTLSSINMLLIGKFAKYCIFPLMPSFWKQKSGNKRIQDILFGVISRSKIDYKESEVSTLIGCYFKERDDLKNKGDPAARYLTDQALVSTISQFLNDGALTIGVLVEIIFKMLVEHPEEQEKIYDEIVEVIGTNRLPTLEDKNKLPYTNAFLYEVIRFSDFFPQFTNFQCTKETTIQGYRIPKGSVILTNFYAAQRNPKDYENPNEFNPSRYLTSPDKQRPNLPVIFGVGKRSCIGEAFSMIQIFLLLTTIVQNFRISFPKGYGNSPIMFWSENNLQLCASPRSHKSS